MRTLHQQFMAARRAGIPIIAIKTLDPEATMQSLQRVMTNGQADEVENEDMTPIIQWDIVNGWRARNKRGDLMIDQALNGAPRETTINPIAQLITALDLPFLRPKPGKPMKPVNPVLFLQNAHAYLDRSYGERHVFIQAVWNLRTPFRESLRSVVLLGPEFDFPEELRHDVLILDEPLPTEQEIESIVRTTTTAAGIPIKDDQVLDAVTALRGLVAFEAENTVAMSLSKSGLKTDECWQRKKQLISTHKALTVYIGGQPFSMLGGLSEIKRRFNSIINGKAKPRIIVWIDEIEKAMAGIGHEGSGTSSDQLGVILNEMQEKLYTGALFVGVPGAAKSAVAKAIATEANCITIKLDLGGSKGEGLVGQAENEIRSAFKIIEAVAGIGGAFFVATSNDIRVIRPELKRRMKKGIWFFDLPTKEERDTIWDIYFKMYPSVNPAERDDIDDTDWTGAEIENCVQTADEEGVSLKEAARSIIPVAISGKEDIERLRQEAAGRYNSASYAGVYRKPTQGITAVPTARQFAIEEEEQ